MSEQRNIVIMECLKELRYRILREMHKPVSWVDDKGITQYRPRTRNECLDAIEEMNLYQFIPQSESADP